jgi:3-oxoacyl-[acyl-carrier-protein] synthase III
MSALYDEGTCLGPVSSWFPDQVTPVGNLPELAGLGEARRRQVEALGIDQVHCADGLSEVDLAANAARLALERAALPAGELDALILVQGRAPRYLLASDATRLQALLGADQALAFGIGEMGCVSVSAALTVGSALLATRPGFRRVLIAMGSRAATPSRYRPPMTVLGDGGAAVLLTTSGGGRYALVDHLMRSDGRYSDLFRIAYRDAPSKLWTEECADEPTYSFRLAVESRNRLGELNGELLKRNGLGTGDLAAVLMQNLAAGAFAFWEDALDVAIHPACRANLARYGHLGSIDVLLNLEQAAATMRPGDHVLVMNSSPVAAWSSALLRRLPDGERGAGW